MVHKNSEHNVLHDFAALVLCGGQGERLRPLTEELPKPLVPIRGKPILSYLLQGLEGQGLSKVVLATGYKSEMIEQFVSDGQFAYPVEIMNSGKVDIIKRIQDSLHLFSGDFFIFYGDTLSDVDLGQLQTSHQNSLFPMTVTVWPLQSQFGIFEIEESGKVSSFKEKPVLDKWINIGHFIYNRKLDKLLLSHSRFEDFLHDLVTKGLLHSYRHKGVHLTVNTQKELLEAEREIERLYSDDKLTKRKGLNEQFLGQ